MTDRNITITSGLHACLLGLLMTLKSDDGAAPELRVEANKVGDLLAEADRKAAPDAR